jgi:hypothetical protein
MLYTDNIVSIEAALTAKRKKMDDLENALSSGNVDLEIMQTNMQDNGESLMYSALWLNNMIESYSTLRGVESRMSELLLQQF